jgi:O-antigen ligase
MFFNLQNTNQLEPFSFYYIFNANILVIGGIILAFFFSEKSIKLITEDYIVITFILSLFLSLLKSNYTLVSLQGTISIVVCGLLYFLPRIISKEWLSKGLILLIASVFFQVLIAVIQYVTSSQIGLFVENYGKYGMEAFVNTEGETLNRAMGTFSHPNHLAVFLSMSLFLAIGYLLNERDLTNKLKTKLVLSITVLASVGVILSSGRFAFIVVVLFISYLLLAFRGKIKHFKSAIRLDYYLIGAFVTLLLTITPFFGNLYSLLYNPFSKMESRLFLIRKALEISNKNNMSGTGLHTFRMELYNHDKAGFYFFDSPPHNVFFTLLAETGIFSTFIFIMLIFFTFMRVESKIRSLNFFVTLSCLIYVINSLVYANFPNFLFFYFSLFLGIQKATYHNKS